MHKIKLFFLLVISISLFSFITVSAIEMNKYSNYLPSHGSITPNDKMLGVIEDQREVDENFDALDLAERGFRLIGNTPDISLYLNEDIFNIAVLDHQTNYVWYGYYPEYENKGYTNTVSRLIESGVTIDYYDATTLNEAKMSLSNPDAGTEIDYKDLSNGVEANINMVKMGISFTVVITIEDDQVFVKIPYESIVEVPYQTVAMRIPRVYKLQSIMVFPYFGSANYEINGYAFVPDGSGALIRYQNIPYNTAYIKRLYGRDLGIQTSVTTLNHLKEEAPVTLPIYGINHGYQQSAFLAELISGFGAAELHSYPYRYNNIDLNTTFFVYRTRDRSLIRLSGGTTSSIPLINKDPYPSDFEMRYSFLNDSDASYSGMAKRYRKNLNLESVVEEKPISMHLEVVGLDYKPSLLGKVAVRLTTYKELISMIDDMTSLGLDQTIITYRSWNQGGFFNKNSNRYNPASKLGGTRNFNKLLDRIELEEGIELSLYQDPLVTAEQKAFQSVLRRTTLDIFNAPIESSRLSNGYYMTTTGVSDRLLSNASKYEKNGINSLSLESLGSLQFSYQLGKNTVYREQMIEEIQEELMALDSYDIGLYQPADYTFEYINRYYHMYYQSNLYSFMTDSIPFISMALAGHVELYTQHLNYINDLEIMKLRMIEYGLSPSFIVTHEEGHMLRYTNYEYLYTTEFDVWKDKMAETYQDVSSVLNQVNGFQIVSHRYIAYGISEVKYSNNKTIYVNYTDQVYSNGDILIEPFNTFVKEGL